VTVTNDGTMGEGLVVFYDGDCGFCTRSARVLRVLDRPHRLTLAPLHEAPAAFADAPPMDRLLESMHVRDARGRWTDGGAAWLRIADVVPLLRPLAVAGRLPVLRRLVEPAYTLVAANRHRISRWTGDRACHVDRLPR
jgi:predicted DCC family thiol-disulfide oxidoreductase YuxK